MVNNCRRIVENKMCKKEDRSHFDCKTSGLAASSGREATIHSNYALRVFESQIWIWLRSLTHPFVVNKKKLCLDRRRRGHHSHQLPTRSTHIFSCFTRHSSGAANFNRIFCCPFCVRLHRGRTIYEVLPEKKREKRNECWRRRRCGLRPLGRCTSWRWFDDMRSWI